MGKAAKRHKNRLKQLERAKENGQKIKSMFTGLNDWSLYRMKIDGEYLLDGRWMYGNAWKNYYRSHEEQAMNQKK